MSSTIKKLLAIIMCVALVFCYTACGGNGEQADDTADEGVSEETVDPDDPTGEAEEPEDTQEESGEDEEVIDPAEIQNLEDKEADLAALQQAAEASDEPYTGTYVETQAGRGVIIINKVGDVYSVVVSWSDSAYESFEWIFSGNFDENGVLEYTDCIKKDIVYEVEEEGTVSKVYENGTGRLRLTNDGVIWEDDIEHVADDANFMLSSR